MPLPADVNVVGFGAHDCDANVNLMTCGSPAGCDMRCALNSLPLVERLPSHLARVDVP